MIVLMKHQIIAMHFSSIFQNYSINHCGSLIYMEDLHVLHNVPVWKGDVVMHVSVSLTLLFTPFL